MFDAGADMTPYIDTAHATRPGRTVQRVNVDFPVDLLRQIDAEADRIGVTRQAFIKLRIADAVRQTNESFTNRTVVHDEIEEHAKHLEPDAQARFVRLREICRKAKIGKESDMLILYVAQYSNDLPVPHQITSSGDEVWRRQDIEQWLIRRSRIPHR
jgi:hypothetical protein